LQEEIKKNYLELIGELFEQEESLILSLTGIALKQLTRAEVSMLKILSKKNKIYLDAHDQVYYGEPKEGLKPLPWEV